MKLINFVKIGLISTLFLAGTNALAQQRIVIESFANAPTTLPTSTVASKFKKAIMQRTGLNDDKDIGVITIQSIHLAKNRMLSAAPSTSQKGAYMSIQTSAQVVVNEAKNPASSQYYAVSYAITKIPEANFSKVMSAVNGAMEGAIIFAVCSATPSPCFF